MHSFDESRCGRPSRSTGPAGTESEPTSSVVTSVWSAPEPISRSASRADPSSPDGFRQTSHLYPQDLRTTRAYTSCPWRRSAIGESAEQVSQGMEGRCGCVWKELWVQSG